MELESYMTRSGWVSVKESLESQLGIPHIETAVGERWKCDHLVSGEIEWDNGLFPPPEDLE